MRGEGSKVYERKMEGRKRRREKRSDRKEGKRREIGRGERKRERKGGRTGRGMTIGWTNKGIGKATRKDCWR
jgi:hypothetical protein